MDYFKAKHFYCKFKNPKLHSSIISKYFSQKTIKYFKIISDLDENETFIFINFKVINI